MTDPRSTLCAAQAEARGDDLRGTAPLIHAWILIEHPGPWPHVGFSGLDLDPDVVASVVRASRMLGARILLVRRAGGRTPRRVDGVGTLAPAAAWAVLRAGQPNRPGQAGSAGGTGHAPLRRWGQWSDDRDLLAIEEAVHQVTDAGFSDRSAAAQPPQLLVCTHGIHDTCCAVWGRPVAAALDDLWPQDTWECSHVGGDRFAANLVLAPDGLYFGALSVHRAVEIVHDYRRGILNAANLRGICTMSAPEQVAVTEALRLFGPAGPRDVAPAGITRAGSGWVVTLAGSGVIPARLRVELRRIALAPAQLTCHAAGLARPVRWDVVGTTIED